MLKMSISIKNLSYCIVYICIFKSVSSYYFSVDYSAEAREILNYEGIKTPTSNEKKLAKKIAYERHKNGDSIDEKRVIKLVELERENEELLRIVVPLNCRRLFSNFMKNFGRGYVFKIGCASDIYPAVREVFKQTKAFVRNRFDVIRQSVLTLLHLYKSNEQLVGSTEEPHLDWINRVKTVYHDLSNISICISTKPYPILRCETFLTKLILDFKNAKNESEAVQKFQQQCHSRSWSEIIPNDAIFMEMAVHVPEHEKNQFINQILFNLTDFYAGEVDFVTDIFITETYFLHYENNEYPKWYEQCATVLYFCRPWYQVEFKEKLVEMYGSKLDFRNMVDQFCVEFANLYGEIRDEYAHDGLWGITKYCRSNSTEIREYIKEIGAESRKDKEYHLIASVIGLI